MSGPSNNSINSDQQEASSSKSLMKTPSRDNSRVPTTTAASEIPSTRQIHAHSRTSSWDLRVSRNHGHSRNASLHSRNSSADLNKFVRNDLGLVLNQIQQNQSWIDPLRVQIIKAHHNWIVVAYSNFFCCWRMRDYGWKLIFTSPSSDHVIERIAINSKMNLTTSNETPVRMVAISYGSEIRLWGISDDGGKSDIIGTFNLNVRVEFLFFIGNQLVALSSSGKIGVWHSNMRNFQIQDLLPILSFDHAGSFLLLGCNNGSIYYIGKRIL